MEVIFNENLSLFYGTSPNIEIWRIVWLEEFCYGNLLRSLPPLRERSAYPQWFLSLRLFGENKFTVIVIGLIPVLFL